MLGSQQESARQKVAAYIVVGCVIGIAVASFAGFMNGVAKAGPIDRPQGVHDQSTSTVKNVVLTYSYETSPSSTSGDDSLAVESIQFYPNYVLVRASNGNTSLFAVEKLRQFSYRPAPSK